MMIENVMAGQTKAPRLLSNRKTNGASLCWMVISPPLCV
jgi:hypothetical protein